MTTSISNLVEQVKTATNYQKNKHLLREKILTDLHVPYNGGLFLVNQQLLAFLATWSTDSLFLEDVYNNPIQITRTELLTLAQQHYQTVMNEWHIQHNELKRIRKI